MPDRRLRLWLLSLDRFELRLRVQAGRARNAFVKAAAESYAANQGAVPSWLKERHQRRVKALLEEHYAKVIPHFAALALKPIKSRRLERKAAEGLFQSLLAEWTSREALRKASLIAATDMDDVRDALQAGLEEGLGAEEIARRIRKVSATTPFRAATVARTETHAAATFGAAESARRAEQQLGVKLLKEWLPTQDDRTRPEHLAMSGHPPIPLDEKFLVGGETMDRPGDPAASAANLINCRCALIVSES